MYIQVGDLCEGSSKTLFNELSDYSGVVQFDLCDCLEDEGRPNDNSGGCFYWLSLFNAVDPFAYQIVWKINNFLHCCAN